VLLRALRDFNLGKLTSDDTSIFMGLLNDLFPKTLELVPRAREVSFETKVRQLLRSLRLQPSLQLMFAFTSLFPAALGTAPTVASRLPKTVPHFIATVLSLVACAPLAAATQVREAATELGYQPDETFCLKIGQLRELVSARVVTGFVCWITLHCRTPAPRLQPLDAHGCC
jgi:hypothetical protein